MTAIALLVPLLVVANGIYVLAHPWFVRFEYQRHGFPDPNGQGVISTPSSMCAQIPT